MFNKESYLVQIMGFKTGILADTSASYTRD